MLAVAEEEGVDPSHLDALVSMREARTRFAEVRQDGGYHGQRDGGGWPRSKSKSSLAISFCKRKPATGIFVSIVVVSVIGPATLNATILEPVPADQSRRLGRNRLVWPRLGQ